MAREIVAMVYSGVRYPISNDVAEFVISKIESFESALGSDFVEVPTTDGRQVLLHVGQNFPIAFEAEADR